LTDTTDPDSGRGTELAYIHERLRGGIKSGEFENGAVIDLAALFPHLNSSQIEHANYILDGYTGSEDPKNGLLHRQSYQWIEGTTSLTLWYPAIRLPRRAVVDAVAKLNAESAATERVE